MLYINEWRFALRQPLVLLSFVLTPAFAFLLSAGVEVGDISIEKQLQMSLVTLQMLVLAVLVGILGPLIMLRDTNFDMAELVDSTPISYFQRWLFRFLLLLSIVMLAFCLSALVLIISYSFQFGFKLVFIELSIIHLLFLVLPSSLLLSAIALWIMTRLTGTMTTYVLFMVIWIGYLLLASMSGSPVLAGSSVVSEDLYQMMLWFDPHGITPLLESLNKPLNGLTLEFLGNRLLTLCLSICLFYLSFVKPNWRLFTQNKKIINKQSNNDIEYSPALIINGYQTVPVKKYWFLSTFTLTKVSLISLLNSRLTLLILVAWPLLIFNEVLSGFGYIDRISQLQTNSIDALNRVAYDLLPLLSSFLLALWSWQVCTRNKACHIHELIAATPVKNHQLVLAHIFTLWTVFFILLLLTGLSCSFAEWFAGSQWLGKHYLIQLSLTAFPQLLLVSLFVAIFHWFRSSFIAVGIIIIILMVKFTSIASMLGLTHTLWNIADAPLQEPDNFWGFRGSMSIYWPYMQVWSLVVALLVTIGIVFSHRGTESNQNLFKHSTKLILTGIIIIAGVLFNLHSQLIAEKPLLSSDKREAWKAHYEKQYAHWQFIAQPVMKHIDAKVDFYPSKQQAQFTLNYKLVNQSENMIKEILIGRAGFYEWAEVSMPGANQTFFDAELNQSVYHLENPMKPGEERVLQTSFIYSLPQLWPMRSHQMLSPEFNYLRGVPLLPTVGYQKQYQLQVKSIRKKYELEPLKITKPSLMFTDTRKRNENYNWVSIDSLISTEVDHYGVTQGKLINSWKNGTRAYYQYQTVKPIRAIPSWLSLPYSATSQEFEGIKLNVYARQSSLNNSQAVDISLTAMRDTLDWFSKNITPYKAKQLSLVEVPDIGKTGYALPQIILINSSYGFRAFPAPEAEFDQRYRRVVHETAHQWFGHDIGNGVQEDRAFLIESMVKYIELVLIEKKYGQKAMNALVSIEKTRYQQAQRNNIRATLALVDATEIHDQYSRATLVFAILREELGDSTITQALQQLWLKYSYPNKPANSMDFVRELKRTASVEQQMLIDELLLSDDISFFE